MLSKYLFPKRREDKFHSEMSGLVLDVQDRIDLGNLERLHLSGVGDHLHRKVRFSIIGSAAHRSGNAGGVVGIEKIGVERRQRIRPCLP